MAILKSKQKPGFAAGIYSDMTLDGPDIGTLVAVVDRAKNLPNRKAIGKQDPYCAMRLAKEAKKTNTDRRGGQTPKWDQELRFDVHDSPDYYKLKVSIFNDDKKTELIGEAWIDLSNVIKLGGGQSDEWHQLNYKSKYAGDVRIELTYYDTREQPQEKRRRERSQITMAVEVESDPSLPVQRSLGPREIKRRPLPTSPAELASQQTPPPQSAPTNSRSAPVPQAPCIQQSPQQEPVHAPVPLRPRTRSTSPLPEQYIENNDYLYEQSIDVEDFAHPSRNINSYDQRSSQTEHVQPWQQPLGSGHSEHIMNSSSHFNAQDYTRQAPQSGYQLPTADNTAVFPDEQEIWHQRQRPRSVHFQSEPTTPLHSSPAHRPSPIATHSDTQLVRHQQQYQSPYNALMYSESPLRQTVSHQESQPYQSQECADVPPPLPPKHRETPTKRPRNDYPPSAFVPQPLRIGQKRASLSDRSPLQSIEDGYDFERHTQQPKQYYTPTRNSAYMAPSPTAMETPEHQIELYNRRNTYDSYAHASEPQLPRQRPKTHSRRNSYEIRHPSFSQEFAYEPQPMTPHDVYHSGQGDGYQPSVEDAPPSPGLQPTVARKAIGAQAKKLNNVPFGPDAYDVLNPANSPVTNEGTSFQTPEQAKEAARFREVEKARDLGPIIGNDGREIDPSDHLPSDTWAPEPERKNRPPEHVIHIRSKQNANRPAGARSAPIIIHSRGSNMPGARSSPVASSQQTESPTSIGNAPRIRNRLQKPAPTPIRPQQTQTHGHTPTSFAASSPALRDSPQQSYHEESAPAGNPHSRRPSYDNRLPDHLTRPPLSEYQVPVGNSQAQRRGSRNNSSSPVKAIEYKSYESTPIKPMPVNYSSPYVEQERRSSHDPRIQSYNRRNSYDNRSDYSYENHTEMQQSVEQPVSEQRYFADPLAAEMSLIDIGPSRNNRNDGSINNRMMVRRW